ncbi:MAG: hypothetical protein C4K60_19960 [Ideonella sp. MAG2]|nr:MAG: hypothetical protein C4K60_19960 [Ideonella sp. MAG2]
MCAVLNGRPRCRAKVQPTAIWHVVLAWHTRPLARWLLAVLLGLLAMGLPAAARASSGHMLFIGPMEEALTLDQVLALPQAQWKTAANNATFGYHHGDYWFQQESLLPALQGDTAWRLTIDNPVLDEIDLWVRFMDTRGQTSAWRHWRLGDKQVFEARPLKARTFTVPLDPQGIGFEAQKLQFVARLNTTSSVQFPTEIARSIDFETGQRNASLAYGLYIGLMGGFFVYNLILWLVTRERLYGWYIGWISHFAMFLLSLEGLTFQFLWPEAVRWNDTVLVYCLGIAVFFSSSFINEFLKPTPGSPVLSLKPVTEGALQLSFVALACLLPYRLGIQMVILMALLLVSRSAIQVVIAHRRGYAPARLLFLAFRLGIQMVILMALLLVSRSAIQVVIAHRRGYAPARLLFLAFSVVLLGAFVLTLQRWGMVGLTRFTKYVTLSGSALEVMLLSLVLGDRLTRAREVAHAAREMILLNAELSSTNRQLDQERELAEKRNVELLALQQRIEREADLRDQERMRFLASSVHDLKQPLQAISTALHPLAHAFRNDEPRLVEEMLGLMQKATHNMRDQLAALLDLSRLESGLMTVSIKPVHLKSLVETLLPELHQLAVRQRVSIRTDLPQAVWVETDEQLLRRVVLNLASNGIKYADAAKAQRELIVSVSASESICLLQVRDNGLGIHAEHVNSGEIFRPFVQVHNHLSEDIKGVGLGLSIVASSIKLLPSHRLEVQSEPGVGSCFSVTLPRASAALPCFWRRWAWFGSWAMLGAWMAIVRLTA